MSRKTLSPLVAVSATALLIAPLAGCDTYDPQLRAGLWHPTHPNRANLTMMIANPADLVRGRSSGTTDGVLAAAAVDRLEIGKVKKLPEAGLSEITVKSQGGGGE